MSLERKNRKVGLIALSGALAMLGVGYASVPLYRIFCQVTGFGGTTQRVSEAEAERVALSDGTISVRFDSNVDSGMPWRFHPEQSTATARLGERRMAVFLAKNTSNEPITGVASFNVVPEAAGKYFNKVQCFCFSQQTLAAGQEIRMPVIYFVDPAIKGDPDARGIQQITLSYTFHKAPDSAVAESAKALDRGGTGG